MNKIVIRFAVVAAVVLSVGWTSAYGYIPGEALILPAAVAVATPVAIAMCAMETNPPVGSIRARRNLDVWEREGLAVSRVLASPLNVLLAPCGMNYVNCTKKNRPVFDKVATTPAVLVASVLYGACGTVDEIFVGTFEMLTTMKVNYANASNVAILVSFGPVVTTFMAKAFCRRAQPTFRKVWVGRGVNSCDSQ